MARRFLTPIDIPPVTLVDAATITVNAAQGSTFDVTLLGSRILGNPTGAFNGQRLLFRVRQDTIGGRTLTFDTKYRFGINIPTITLSTGPSKLDRVGVEYVAADDRFDIIALMQGY